MENKNQGRIPIFFHCSDEFCSKMSVTMTSILYNTSSLIDFYVLETGISSANKQKVERMQSQYPHFSVTWIPFEFNNVFKKEYIEPLEKKINALHWPGIHGFCTPFFPLLAPNLDTLIYLDCDLIVLGDIKELYEQGTDGFAIAAVPDTVVPIFLADHYSHLNKKIPYSKFGQYFNAGMLIVNAKKFRKENIIKEYFRIAHTENVPICDQDILNRLFGSGRFKSL